MKCFKNNLFLSIVILLIVIITIFILSEICVRLTPFSRHWHGDITSFWNLEKYTNILGNYDNKEIIEIEHTGVPDIFWEKVLVKKSKDTVRIICLGTSSTEGFSVKNPDNVYPKVLERILNNRESDLNYEVINAAIGGYTSFQLLIYLKQILLKLSPDIVTLYLGYNDSNYNGPITDKNYWQFINREIKHLPYDMKKYFIRYGTTNPALAKLQCLWNKSKLYLLFKLVLLNIRQKIMEGYYVKRVPVRDFKEVLNQFIKLGKKNKFYLIFIPEAIRGENYEPEVGKYHKVMINMAFKNKKVKLVEVNKVFQEKPEEFFFDKVHPTKEGHLVIAQKLYEVLIKENIIK